MYLTFATCSLLDAPYTCCQNYTKVCLYRSQQHCRVSVTPALHRKTTTAHILNLVMEKMMSMLLMLVMAGCFIQSSHAVTCYQCIGSEDDCGDPFTAGSSSTCTGIVCAKANYESGGRMYTDRGCYTSRSQYTAGIGCQTATYHRHAGSTLCLCDSYKCNGAGMTKQKLVMLVGFLIGQLIYIYN